MGGLQPGIGECAALHYAEGRMFYRKSEAPSGEEGLSPYQLPECLWEDFFEEPTQWWDNRRSKRTRQVSKAPLWIYNRHQPSSVHLQLAELYAGMKTPPKSVSTSFEVQAAVERLEPHERNLDIGMCRKLCENGRISHAVDAVTLWVQQGYQVHNNLFYRLLKRCIAQKDLFTGRRIHALTIKSGFEGDAFLATHLISLYASHGTLEEATQVFTKVCIPSLHNWTTIILAYATHGEAAQALELYRKMLESTTIKPDDRVYVAVLKACATAGDLAAGKEVHAHILAILGEPNIYVQAGLVSMYAKCGSLADARRVFDGLPERDVVSWNAMLAGYAQRGMGQEALSLYSSMQQEGLTPPNSVTYVCLLQACASVGVGALDQGKQLHVEIEEQGLQEDLVLGGSLVNMYAKCGSLGWARMVFDKLPKRTVVTWTVLMAGYTEQGMGAEALSLYSYMQQEGLTSPDSVTYVCLLQACALVGVGALDQGKQLHAQIEADGLQDDLILGGSLVNMYAKCGMLGDAQRVFDRLSERDVLTWNAMLAGYAQQGMGEEALRLYGRMQLEGTSAPDSVTYVCLTQACAGMGAQALGRGKELHAEIEVRGLQEDIVLSGSLVNMYAKCSSLRDARSVFDRLSERHVVTWTALITGYAQQGMGQEALSLYRQMQKEGLTPPNSVTYVCLLQACASLGPGALDQGKQLHAEIQELGLTVDLVVGGSLVNMYAKCGSLGDACRVFDKLAERNVVTWTALIAGHSQQGLGQESLNLYYRMKQEGLSPPNAVTYLCILQACAFLAALPLARQLHAQIEERGLLADVAMGAGLVNMYAKCGSMSDSQQVFDALPERPIEAWNALTGGYSRQGDSEYVFDLVDRMRLEGVQPDGITFLCLLTVCSHVGQVDKGRKYFQGMKLDYGISPSIEHYTCMMDLLGRAGELEEALQMAKIMPFIPTGVVWLTLLGACRKWKNVAVGNQAFEFAVTEDEKSVASYVLMSNIYASAQMWEEAKEIQSRRVKSGAMKMPGQSWWTDIGGVLHTFVVGEHAQIEGTAAKAASICSQIEAGTHTLCIAPSLVCAEPIR